jgi:hypothetical protein
MASKYSEAGKGSTTKLKQKKQFDENFDKIFGKDKYFDSDDASDSWDEDRMDIIGLNGNTGEHYIK